MKLSEMTNEQATEAMLRLTGPIKNLCEDSDIVQFIDTVKSVDDNTPFYMLMGKMIPELVRLAFIKHKNDVYEVVGALLMVPAGEVADMKFGATVKELQDSYDDMLTSFFSRSVTQTTKSVSLSA